MNVPRINWIDGESIEELLDVVTAACTVCGNAARVPEDVLAVLPSPDHSDQQVVAICPACTATMNAGDIEQAMQDMARLIARAHLNQTRRHG